MSKRNNNEYRTVIVFLAFMLFASSIIIFSTHTNYGGGDNYSHFKYARWGWKYQNLLLIHWGKPVFTILCSPFAQLGFDGARLYNVIMGLLTAFFSWKLARDLRFGRSIIILLLVLFTPLYFILMFTSLTEITFSFFLVLSIYLFFKEKYILTAILFSFLPLARNEGVVLFPLIIAALLLKKQFKSLPFLLTGFLVFSLIGYPCYGDFWWLINRMPYTGEAKSIYGSGSLFHFISRTNRILGYPIAGLFILGFIRLGYLWITKDKAGLTNKFYILLLISGSYLTFLAAHSYVWWKGVGNSLGIIRVMGAVTPLAAITALVGFNAIFDFFYKRGKSVALAIGIVLSGWIIYQGIATHTYGFGLSRTQELIVQAVDYIKRSNLRENKIYYFDPFLSFKMDFDPHDSSKSRYGIKDQHQLTLGMPDKSVVVWDAHYAPNRGRIPLERLLNEQELKLLKIIKPCKPFKVLGGYDYAIYIFQKDLSLSLQNKSENIRKPLPERFNPNFWIYLW